MHSHNRTLIARLGFADPDKGDSRHDAACRYLATRAIHESVATEVVGEGIPAVVRPAFEVPFKKNAGFIDLRLPYLKLYDHDDPEVILGGQLARYRDMDRDHYAPAARVLEGGAIEWSSYVLRWLNVEVKVSPVPIGNILRQINFYRSHVGGPWLLATLFPLSHGDHEVLRGADISHALLGDAFHRWMAEEQVRELTAAPASTFVL